MNLETDLIAGFESALVVFGTESGEELGVYLYEVVYFFADSLAGHLIKHSLSLF
jgi:hypothetical protein